jgi:hypothetical protein
MFADFANKLGNGNPVGFASSSIELVQVPCRFGRHVCDLLKEDGLEDAGGRLVGMTELRFRGQRVRARAQKETKNADARDGASQNKGSE